MTAALAIFVKTPGWSPVKTRLAAGIGTAAAERFHRLAAAAVAEVALAARRAGFQLTSYFAVAEAAALEHANWRDLPALWQGDGGLGVRLHRVCAELQARHERVLLIGADAPQLDVGMLGHALAALEDEATPFALGRARDGGFWLFGARMPIAASIWNSVRYSTTHAADDLIAALTPHGSTAALPTLTDVDLASDLPALADALDALREVQPAQRALRHWVHSIRAFDPARTIRA